jgi:hypothetical protein
VVLCTEFLKVRIALFFSVKFIESSWLLDAAYNDTLMLTAFVTIDKQNARSQKSWVLNNKPLKRFIITIIILLLLL